MHCGSDVFLHFLFQSRTDSSTFSVRVVVLFPHDDGMTYKPKQKQPLHLQPNANHFPNAWWPGCCPPNWLYCSGECRSGDYVVPTEGLDDVFETRELHYDRRGGPSVPSMCPTDLDAALCAMGLLAESCVDDYKRGSRAQKKRAAAAQETPTPKPQR